MRSKYRALFAGMAPMSNPRLIVAVMIDEPRGKGYGGTVAGPVFASVTSGSLQLLGVPPTRRSKLRRRRRGRCAAKTVAAPSVGDAGQDNRCAETAASLKTASPSSAPAQANTAAG